MTLFRMCTIIFEFGPTTIKCLELIWPLFAYGAYGQLLRCQYARDILGEDWGSQKAEKSRFFDGRTNKTLDGVDFIQEGFEIFRGDPYGRNLTTGSQ
jgi:hypothetical protein